MAAINFFKHSGTDATVYRIARQLIENEIYVDKEAHKPSLSEGEIRYMLDQFFTDRQIEIIMKKQASLKLTKTEAEYYSRSVKKKLRSLFSDEWTKLADQFSWNL